MQRPALEKLRVIDLESFFESQNVALKFPNLQIPPHCTENAVDSWMWGLIALKTLQIPAVR